MNKLIDQVLRHEYAKRTHPLAAIATTISAGHQCFAELAFEIFADMGGDFDYGRLNAIDQRRLAAAFLRDDPSRAEDVLSEIPPTVIAGHLADLLSHTTRAAALDNCDCIDLAGALWSAIWPNKYLEILVQDALENQWEAFERTRDERAEAEKAEAMRAYGG